MALAIIIFISIKGVLWQGIVKFNLVRTRTQQGLIFYFCPGLNLSWIIQCSSPSQPHALSPTSVALFRIMWLFVSLCHHSIQSPPISFNESFQERAAMSCVTTRHCQLHASRDKPKVRGSTECSTDNCGQLSTQNLFNPLLFKTCNTSDLAAVGGSKVPRLL